MFRIPIRAPLIGREAEMVTSLSWEPAVWVARMLIGVTFLISGVSKVRDVEGLAFAILRYQVLPKRWAWSVARPLARLLTIAELLVAVLLLSGTMVRYAGVAAVALTAVFADAVGVNLRRGWAIPCYCLTNSPYDRIGPLTLARLGVLAVAGALLVLAGPGSGSIAPPGGETLGSVAPVVSLAMSSITLVLLMGPVAILSDGVADARHAGAARRAARAGMLEVVRWREERRKRLAERDAAGALPATVVNAPATGSPDGRDGAREDRGVR